MSSRETEQGAATALWLVTWVEVRGRWRALASLALLLGLVDGVVLGAVAEVAVVGVPPDRWGESPYAAVVLRLSGDDRGTFQFAEEKHV